MDSQRSAQEAFSHNYETDHWSGGSGVGSRNDLNGGYRSLVQRLVSANDVGTVVDAGCGDWQFSRMVDWSNVRYTGFDVVESVLEDNRRNFARSNISFDFLDFSRQPLPKGDLLLCKDVLQHWPIDNVRKFLEVNLPRFRYVVVTNDVASVHCDRVLLNSDIDFGAWRTLDLELSPFGVKARKRMDFDYLGEWTKRSVLMCSTTRKLVAGRDSKSAYMRFDSAE